MRALLNALDWAHNGRSSFVASLDIVFFIAFSPCFFEDLAASVNRGPTTHPYWKGRWGGGRTAGMNRKRSFPLTKLF
eukprot:gene9344-6567_t